MILNRWFCDPARRTLLTVVLGLAALVGGAAWADDPPLPLTPGLTKAGADLAQVAPRGDAGLIELFAPGSESWTFGLGWAKQHNLPTGPRTLLYGDVAGIRYAKHHTTRDEWGLELALAKLRSETLSDISAWGASASYRRYFSLTNARAMYFSANLGLVHLNDLVPELSTHTNFVESAGLGMVWRAEARSTWGIEYRFQHVSNAGLSHPNIGLNSSELIAAYTFYF